METVQIGLADNGRGRYSSYIFPEDYYEIPGVNEFQDTQAARSWAVEKLTPYKGQKIDLYVTVGLLIELLAALSAAAELNIEVSAWHYDKFKKIYIPQNVQWKGTGHRFDDREDYILCAGRHRGMKGTVIFEQVPDDKLFDFSWQKDHAKAVLSQVSGRTVYLYLSGLSSICISTLNAAYELGLPVVPLHYDYDSEEFFPQELEY